MKMDGSGAGWAVRAIVRVYDRLGGCLVFSALCIPPIPVWVHLTKLLLVVVADYCTKAY